MAKDMKAKTSNLYKTVYGKVNEVSKVDFFHLLLL